jgi:hypothetical protein
MNRALVSELAGKILRAKDVQGIGPLGFSEIVYKRPELGSLRSYLPFSTEVSERPIAYAEVWQGGWVVQCPLCRGGLEYGDPQEPLFRCCSCWNAAVSGSLLQVEYPEEAEMIEAELMKRPQGEARGWRRGETLEDLKTETEARRA